MQKPPEWEKSSFNQFVWVSWAKFRIQQWCPPAAVHYHVWERRNRQPSLSTRYSVIFLSLFLHRLFNKSSLFYICFSPFTPHCVFLVIVWTLRQSRRVKKEKHSEFCLFPISVHSSLTNEPHLDGAWLTLCLSMCVCVFVHASVSVSKYVKYI